MCPAAMNEMTWRKVQDWEQLHCEECKYPTLLKFEGKPHDLRYTPCRGNHSLSMQQHQRSTPTLPIHTASAACACTCYEL
jgi:hypothetical protein